MCGISGIVKFNSSVNDRHQTIASLKSMNSVLQHRGPDDNDVWCHENHALGLGQTRLSILDLSSAGHQPMPDSSNGNVVTYNGEIFNYRMLNNTYLKNLKFDSETDTETILKMYRKFGLEMISKLNGMFAFALWDNCKSELIIARDKSGKKALILYSTGRPFCFLI